jgi:hypothetical protein
MLQPLGMHTWHQAILLTIFSKPSLRTLLKNHIFEDVCALHHYFLRTHAFYTTTSHVCMLDAPLQPAYTHKSCKN